MFVPGKNKSKPKQNNHTHKPKGAVNLEFKQLVDAKKKEIREKFTESLKALNKQYSDFERWLK